MAEWGSCDLRQLKEFQKRIEKLQKEQDKFCEECARHLAARLLAKVIKRTPVGTSKTGGTLRRGWTAQSDGSGSGGSGASSAASYAQSLKVHHYGEHFVVEIINPVYYAPYVEFGHRTADHKGWVPGRFMLTISERELQNQAPKLLEKKLADYLKGVL